MIRLRFLLCLLAVLIPVRFCPRPDEAGESPADKTFPDSGGEKQNESLTEVNKQLTNPISNEWSLTRLSRVTI